MNNLLTKIMSNSVNDHVLAVCSHIDTAIKIKEQYGFNSNIKIKESTQSKAFCVVASKSCLDRLGLEIKNNLDAWL